MVIKMMGRGPSRMGLIVTALIAILLSASLSANAVTGEVYTNTGNLSERTAASHLLGARPRAPEVIGATFRWTGSMLVLRIHVVQTNPYRRSSRWEVTQIAALDLFVNGRERMTDTNTTSLGGPEGYSCGAHGTDLIGRGIITNYSTNTYIFKIPRAAFLRCGLRARQVVHVLADSMMSTDNGPSGTNPPRMGTWAAQWSPEYLFRL